MERTDRQYRSWRSHSGWSSLGPSNLLESIGASGRRQPGPGVFLVSVAGFDTHQSQKATHDRLLSGIGEALLDFTVLLRRRGVSQRFTTIIFSEFGTQLAENDYGGTDHGTSGPAFIVGESVSPGIYGPLAYRYSENPTFRPKDIIEAATHRSKGVTSSGLPAMA